MRGDEPYAIEFTGLIDAEFPACAGMNRIDGVCSDVLESSPHARG